MKIFFQNIADELEVTIENPLECSLEQAIEIFHLMPDYDGSHVGFITDHSVIMQITKYDRFLFLIDLMDFNNQLSKEKLLHYQQVYDLILSVFDGYNPEEMDDLTIRKWE